MAKEFDPVGLVKRLLEEPFWIPTIESDKVYSRIRDDDDGTLTGELSVFFDMVGDAYISVGLGETFRFRTYGGGGRSERTRTALMILAEAIRLDNETRPIKK